MIVSVAAQPVLAGTVMPMPPHKVSAQRVTIRPDGLVVLPAVRPPRDTTTMHLIYNAAGNVLAVLLADNETLERMSDAVIAALD